MSDRGEREDFITPVRLAADFELFLEVSLPLQNPNWRITPSQRLMARYLMNPNRHRKLMIQAARKFSKTLVVSNWIAFKALRNPSERIRVFANKQSHAVQINQQALAIVGRMSPWLIPKGRISRESFRWLYTDEMDKEDALIASSAETSITSGRVGLAILDDIEDDQNARTPDARQKLLDRIDEIQNLLHDQYEYVHRLGLDPSLPCFAPDACQLLLLGTPHSPNTIYERTEEGSPLYGLEPLRLPIVDAEGNPTDPMLAGEKTIAEKAPPNTSAGNWRLQFLLDTSVVEDALIRIGELDEKEEQVRQLVCFVDPADTGDETAACWGGMTEGKIHIADLQGSYDWRTRDATESLERVIEECIKKQCREIFIERNFPVHHTLRNLIREKYPDSYIRVTAFSATGKKEDRWASVLAPAVNTHQVSLNPSVLKNRRTKEQFERVTEMSNPEHDDRLDAMTHLVGHYLEKLRVHRKDEEEGAYSKVKMRRMR